MQTVREDRHLLVVEFADATTIVRDPDGIMHCGVDTIRPCQAIGF